MDSLDSQLKQLAALVKQYPANSRGRNQMATRLLMMIEQSGKLFCPRKKSYPPEVYDEALQEVRLYIFRSLDSYDPDKAQMMTWVNRKLDYAFKDSIRRHLARQDNQVSLSQTLYGDETDTNKTVEDNLAVSDTQPLLSEQIRQIIEDDPEDIFKKKHLRGRPEINFQTISLRMFAGYSRRDIAEEWGIQEQSLYSFYARSCKSFREKFEQYLKA